MKSLTYKEAGTLHTLIRAKQKEAEERERRSHVNPLMNKEKAARLDMLRAAWDKTK